MPADKSSAQVRRWFIAAACLTICFLSTYRALRGQGKRNEPSAYAINRADYLDAGQYRFLAGTLKDVDVVGLGESIHLTHEFPLVRIGMVRFLNENMGYHIVAMEGSAVDLWATQDRLLGSGRTETDIAQAQRGLFSIWNTPEMRQLFDYEIESWKTGTPLYITAYDIQPGSGSGTQDIEAFRLLAEGLKTYAEPPAGFDEKAWLDQMAPLVSGCGGYRPENDVAVEQGIESLSNWIVAATPAVQVRYPYLPHAAVLGLVPANLRASLQLCRDLQPKNGIAPAYKPTRDKNAAEYALRLKEIAPNQKLILWAHISHLFYDSTGRSTSVGEILRSRLGTRIYSLGVFGEGGATILIISDVNDSMAYLPVHGIFGALRSDVNDLCPGDCFLALRGTNDSLFTTPHAIFREAFPQPMALARDFDGVVWIKKVHAPDIPLGAILYMGTLAYWHPPFAYLLAVLLALAIFIAFRKVRRRPVSQQIEHPPYFHTALTPSGFPGQDTDRS